MSIKAIESSPSLSVPPASAPALKTPINAFDRMFQAQKGVQQNAKTQPCRFKGCTEPAFLLIDDYTCKNCKKLFCEIHRSLGKHQCSQN